MYLLREDMYNEWSWENGATDIICLTNNYKTIMKHLGHILEEYKKDNRTIEQYRDDISLEEQVKRLASNNDYGVCIDIYETEQDYDNGKNNATLVISYLKVEE